MRSFGRDRPLSRSPLRYVGRFEKHLGGAVLNAALGVEDKGLTEKEAYSVEVVNTVGAGDTFVAGFRSRRLRGWKTEECLSMAYACGACAVAVPGYAKELLTSDEAFALPRGRPEA